MLNPILKPSLDWKNVAKQALLVSAPILMIYLALALLTSSGADRTKRLAAGFGLFGLGSSSLIGLQLQNRKIRQLEHSKQQTQHQLQEKDKQIGQIKTTFQQNYQELESSLIKEKNQLIKLKNNLEQQLQQKQEEVAEVETKLKQQKEAYQKLERDNHEIEILFTQETQEKERLGQDKEKLEQHNEQLKQEKFQLQEQIKKFNQNLKTVQNEQNKFTAQSPSLSRLKIALVGGHPKGYKQVKQKLKHKVRTCKLLPSQKYTPNKTTIKEKIRDVDFIFIITDYNEHSLSNSIYSLQQADQLQGKVIHIRNSQLEIGTLETILLNECKNS